MISIALAAAVLAAVWLPELSHWYVRPSALTDVQLQAARKAPERRLLDEVVAMDLRGGGVHPQHIVAAAEQITRGTLSLPGFAPAPITLPFERQDLTRGLPTYQLMVACLIAPDLLLDAYRITKREQFFELARDAIVAFARFEAAQWVDHGFLWNDHAVGARISVLIKFWAEYRERPDFDPEVGRLVLALVSRSARLLAKPSYYAWHTGHGVLADLALLQIAAAFPELPESAQSRSVATERFRSHLSYYIAPEGATLLHSAGYHVGGVHFLGLALRLSTLNGIAIPADWWDKYVKAVEFYALLRRPDGTLPMFGDTISSSSGLGPRLTARDTASGAAGPLALRKDWPRSDAFAVYPVAGHAIWWDGTAAPQAEAASQTVMTWSYHPGLGHKLADELSVIIWARGRTWLTNAGYWPIGVWGRAQAESWEASNAPHLLDESKQSERTSRVRGLGHSEWIRFMDIERTGPQGYVVRRQVARLINDDTWIVLDHSTDTMTRATATNWTFYPDLVVTPDAGRGRYRVTADHSPTTLLFSVSGSADAVPELVSGRKAPFAGWVVMGRTPVQAAAILVRQPSRDSWSLAAFRFSAGEHDTKLDVARMLDWRDADHWTAVVHTTSGEITLTRDRDRLLVRRHGSVHADGTVALAALDAPAADIKAVREGFRSAAEHYRKFVELIRYRIKVSYILLAAFVVQELLLFVMAWKLPRLARGLRIVSWVAWAAGGTWLSQVYLVVNR